MLNEKRWVLKILEDAKRVSLCIHNHCDVGIPVSYELWGRGPVHDRVHMHNVYNPNVNYTMEEDYTKLAGCEQLNCRSRSRSAFTLVF